TGVEIAPFAGAAAHGEVIINATGGGVAIEALTLAGAENLVGKVLIDVSNPLDFSTGTLTSLPHLTNTTSVGEEVQKTFPQDRADRLPHDPAQDAKQGGILALGDIEAQEAAGAVADAEDIARRQHDIVCQRLAGESGRVMAFGQLRPDEHAGLRLQPGLEAEL